MLEIGSVVDNRYKVLNKVGRGGMSVVYLAMNEKANKPWAIKEVRKDGIIDFDAVRQSLIAEKDILKCLSHPNLPSIVDVIENDDSFLIIMDYIPGNSLDKALEYGAQPQEDVIEWAKQLCDVLGYLHSRTPPIIYRDMKPGNIMVKPDGNVTLIDFGTAREYKDKNQADTKCLGTIGYAAPEQFGGMGQTDARTDIYCLGATLYHLVTGMNPCEPPYEIKPIRDINPALSGGFEQIILKCTRKNPNERYQSAAELMYALEHYNEIDDKHKKKQKKKLWAFLVPAILCIVFAATSAWGYFSAEQKKRENYDYILSSASSASDYYEAIVTDPSRAEAYLGTEDHDGLVEFLTKDGELTAEECGSLTKLKAGLDDTETSGYSLTRNVLTQLQQTNPDGYEDVCYEIGEAILFYYTVDVEKDKYASAATWFQYAQNKYPIAKMYCDISDCLQNISKYAKAEQSAKLYQEYQTLWSQVTDINQNAEEFDDDLRLRVWNEIVRMIVNNATEFCEVSSPQAILDMLDELSDKSNGITNTFLQKNVEALHSSIELAQKKIQSFADAQE